jgi:hypothetical protein
MDSTEEFTEFNAHFTVGTFFRSAPQLDETTKRWRNEQCNGVCEFGGRLTGGGGGAKSTQKSFNLALTCEAIIKITFYMVFSPPHKNSKPEQRANETSNFFFASTRLMRCSPPSNMHLDFKKNFFSQALSSPRLDVKNFQGLFCSPLPRTRGDARHEHESFAAAGWNIFPLSFYSRRAIIYVEAKLFCENLNWALISIFFLLPLWRLFFSVFLSSRQFLRFHTRIAWRGKLYTKEIFSSTGCFRARSERKLFFFSAFISHTIHSESATEAFSAARSSY